MKQGFYRESQQRSKSIAHYVVRIRGKIEQKFKLNTQTWFWRQKLPDIFGIICFMALGNSSERQSMPNLTIPWMITWLWWEQLQKLKVNLNRKIITPHVLLNQVLIVKACPTKMEHDNPDSEAPAQEPWWKWVEMQQQLMAAIKGAQNALKKCPWQGSNQGQRRNSQQHRDTSR